MGPEAEVWHRGPTPWRPAHRGARRNSWELLKEQRVPCVLLAEGLFVVGGVCVCFVLFFVLLAEVWSF